MTRPGPTQTWTLRINRGTAAAALTIAFALAVAMARPALAQTFTVLHSFAGEQDGGVPFAGLARDTAGNLYGTTFQNGAHGRGTVFRLAPAGSGWIFTALYEFAGGGGGGWPVAKPTVASDGTLYGTTLAGGLNDEECPGNGYSGCGVVFHLRPQPTICKAATCPWVETVVHSFTGGFYQGTDGWNPRGEVVFDQAGALYGTTYYGGTETGNCSGGCGTVFQLTNSGGQWSENQLYSFAAGVAGAYPAAGVIFDSSGRLYSTTSHGGGGAVCQGGCGTVFALIPSGGSWTEKILHAFQGGADGAGAWGGLVMDASGNLYGATVGGPPGTCGVAYELTPSNGPWTFSTIADFPPGNCGLGVFASLVMDPAGNLYGTTNNGGKYGSGTVFKLTPSVNGWTYTSLHDFTLGDDGGFPTSGLVLDEAGNIYGTTSSGGSAGEENCYPNAGCGVVFEITP
jgi:uncharacterized repeat protein (TIGR03803 family)